MIENLRDRVSNGIDQIDIKSLNRTKWISLLLGVLLIIGSFIFLRDPVGSTLGLVMGLGLILVAMGVLKVIRYFTDVFFRRSGYLINGIVDVLFGIFIISNYEVSFITFTLLVSFWVLFSGITRLSLSFSLKREGIDKWWLELISGIISIISGILLMGNFELSVGFITIFVSMSLFFRGILSISAFFKIDKIAHSLKLRDKYKDNNKKYNQKD